MKFSTGKICAVVSALLGAVGTGFLYLGSFAYEAPPVYMDDDLLVSMTRRNAQRRFRQRVGLWLLMLSFGLSGASVVLPD